MLAPPMKSPLRRVVDQVTAIVSTRLAVRQGFLITFAVIPGFSLVHVRKLENDAAFGRVALEHFELAVHGKNLKRLRQRGPRLRPVNFEFLWVSGLVADCNEIARHGRYLSSVLGK